MNNSLADGVEDYSGDRLASPLQPHGDAEHGKSVSEIGGAVERVDEPAIFGSALHPATFLGDNGVLRKSRPQALHDQLFGGAVGLGYQVEFALGFESGMWRSW